jgi:threonine/homoserine/homoserine lactone efflux protein
MYPDIPALAIFLFVGAFSPGPNNLLASYSGFNFGIKKTLPLVYGVTFGFPIVLIAVNSGLSIIFNKFPMFQEILKILGSGFLIYMAYKIAFSNKSDEKEIKNPAKFFNMIIFQFINPKAVLIAIITVSTFISQNENFVRDSIIVISFAIFFSFTSIMSWSLLGKFLQRFANNEKFLTIYNYIMSFLLIICVIMFYV